MKGINKNTSLPETLKIADEIPMGGTDCALPMIWAKKNDVKADAFVVYTDNETWFNRNQHPIQALRDYRTAMGIPAKLVVVGMTATDFSIADPDDNGNLDVVGFDTAAPNVISDFIAGR
jgi:60 kDa SS-A/Ro ribonucleoprotein